MKTKLLFRLFFVMLLITGTMAFSQKVVKMDEITVEGLKKLMDDAGITVVSTGTDYVKIKNTFSWLIYNDKNKGYLTFSVTYKSKEGTSYTKAAELTNKLNKEVAMSRFDYDDSTKTFAVSYYFMCEGGFVFSNLIKAINLFRDTITLALQKDTEMLIL